VRPALIDRRQGVPGIDPPFIKIGNNTVTRNNHQRADRFVGKAGSPQGAAVTGPPRYPGQAILVCRVFLSLIQYYGFD